MSKTFDNKISYLRELKRKKRFYEQQIKRYTEYLIKVNQIIHLNSI